MDKFMHLESEYPGLKISPMEEHRTESLLLFLGHISNLEMHLPQIFLLQYAVPPHLYKRIFDYYELVKSPIYWVQPDKFKSKRRYLFRIKPEFAHRIIKRGYGEDSREFLNCQFDFAF